MYTFLIGSPSGRSLVTAGSEEKIKRALELGAEAGFNYKTEDFAKHVLKHTDNKGVNLILDCIGASFWERNVAALAVDGRWVLYGLLGGGNINGDLLAKILRKRINITGTTLRARSTEYKAELIRDFTEKALPAFQSGQLHPIIDTEFPLERIADAHRYMEENRNTGKILVTVITEGKEEL
ncbi:quinone oxidoreductase PIG3-like [Lingula anatina]|uniref:Quinone oxidoreductase PIG3-like n=1 Tax=Lingula anatina TaxID=7574 RepID=A0A1S3HVS8_LINAN|nr:quinone oxidoreductase PIG3-like [Lingula anatina]|eukprot:XP_013389169.2 quinone oxidoreductase PIG3-like [Lingula anatina]